jgi:hypothetical protein
MTKQAIVRRKVAVISDLHCGHQFGVCPPKYQSKGEHGSIQAKFWDWLAEAAKALGRIDLLVVNGDAIDGNGERNSGIELITPDRHIQVEMAAETVRLFDAARVEVVLGTPYHTGLAEDFERVLAQQFDGKGHDEFICDTNGLVFNFKHKVNVSRNWSSQASGVLREQLLNMLTSILKKGEVKADIVVRSHAHLFVNAVNIGGAVFVTPSLQLDSAYGRRQCSGRPDVGFLSFDIGSKEDWKWELHYLSTPLVERSVSVI